MVNPAFCVRHLSWLTVAHSDQSMNSYNTTLKLINCYSDNSEQLKTHINRTVPLRLFMCLAQGHNRKSCIEITEFKPFIFD